MILRANPFSKCQGLATISSPFSMQAEGLPEISRGLSGATPPVCAIKNHPPRRGGRECKSLFILAPLQGASFFRLLPGVSLRVAPLNPRLISSTPSGSKMTAHLKQSDVFPKSKDSLLMPSDPISD